MKLVFLHGLESGPLGNKARWLGEHYGCYTPQLSTVSAEHAAEDAKRAIYQQEPTLVIGSSFGGAVLLLLCNQGFWRGPSLFLAQAGLRLTPCTALPDGSRAILVHGTRDDVVPIEDSRALARTGGHAVTLVEVDDDHRLNGILGAPLRAWIARLANAG